MLRNRGQRGVPQAGGRQTPFLQPNHGILPAFMVSGAGFYYARPQLLPQLTPLAGGN
jgi:hypothetical protein